MNLSELEELFYKINDIISYIEDSKYKTRRFKLFLGNGDKINFSLPNENLPHLLGINIPYLCSLGIVKETNAFELLKYLVSNPYHIYNLHNKKIISYEKLFSPFIQQKVEIFEKNIKMDLYEIEGICKYDPIRTYHINKNSEHYDYVIIKKYKDNKIGLLGLVKNNFNIYVPMSSQIFNDYESAKTTLDKLIKNQEITIVNGIKITNSLTSYENTFNIPATSKAIKVCNLKKYKNEFNCIIDTSEDYIYMLNEAEKHKDNHFNDIDLIMQIIKSIEEGKIIDIDIYRNTKLIDLIEAYNNFLCQSECKNTAEITEKYSYLKKELENMKDLVKTLSDENDYLATKVNSLEEENKLIKEENTSLKDNENQIMNIIQKNIKK